MNFECGSLIVLHYRFRPVPQPQTKMDRQRENQQQKRQRRTRADPGGKRFSGEERCQLHRQVNLYKEMKKAGRPFLAQSRQDAKENLSPRIHTDQHGLFLTQSRRDAENIFFGRPPRRSRSLWPANISGTGTENSHDVILSQTSPEPWRRRERSEGSLDVTINEPTPLSFIGQDDVLACRVSLHYIMS